LSFLRAPEEFHYRNRIQLQVQNGRRGFFAQRTRDLVEFDQCWIADARLNEKLAHLRDDEIGSARRVELAVDSDGEVQVMAGERDPQVALFGQVNSAQNEVLKTCVLERVALKPAWIMDLYCGSGNLSLPLAERWPGIELTAIELSQSAIARARHLNP